MQEANVRKRSWVVYAAVPVLACIGVVGGIWVGMKLFSAPPVESAEPFQKSKSDSQIISFEAGDQFPIEPCWDYEGRQLQLDSIINDKRTLVFLVTFHCDPCMEMLRSFQQEYRSQLRDDVKLIALLRKEEGPAPSQYRGLLNGMEVFLYDSDHWKRTYTHSFWPTLLGFDASGFVVHGQYGFEGYIDHELKSFFR